MSGQDDSGDKTEEPTPKKLQDARRKGQVSKSKDLTSTLELLAWLLLATLAAGWAGSELLVLLHAVLDGLGQPFAYAADHIGSQAWRTLLALTAGLLLPACAVGVLVEYLQVGSLFATDKLVPKAENLDPVAGLKRMFGLDNLVELLKAVVKTVALLALGWISVSALLPQLVALPWSGQPRAVGAALWHAARPLLWWCVAVFALLSVLDLVHQRFSFRKKMRMSLRDIQKEHKESEGDPHVKGQRRQLAQQWAQQGPAQSARDASVLVVNPTHVAIAVHYESGSTPVPTVTAKGCDEVAYLMRQAAEEAGVPILRNVGLARDMLARIEEGDVIPADLFDIVAEVILWAREVKAALAEEGAAGTPAASPGPDHQGQQDRQGGQSGRKGRRPPGEDLTRYRPPAPTGRTPDWMRRPPPGAPGMPHGPRGG